MGKRTDLICCITVLPVRKWHNFPVIIPHVYTEVEGERIDVALDPGREEKFCKNSEQKIVIPVNISKLRRSFGKETSLRGRLLRKG